MAPAIHLLRQALRDLYVCHWPKFAALRRAHPELSNPVLLNPPHGYLDQPVKLLIVGQETGPRRWCTDVRVRSAGPERAVERLMAAYGSVDRSTSHFWRAVQLLEQRLDLEPGTAAWTNLNKCDVEGRKPSPALAHQLADSLPVLAQEIRLLTPDLVLFLTGPTYDEHLVRQIEARLRPLGPEWPLRTLARVHAPAVLPARSFRTFHPNFLLRFRKPLLPGLLSALFVSPA